MKMPFQFVWWSALTLALAFRPLTAGAVDGVWISGGIDNNWDTPANWIGGSIPDGVSDTAIILTNGPGTNINFNGNRQLATLNIAIDPVYTFSIVNNTLSISAGGAIIFNPSNNGGNNQTLTFSSDVSFAGDGAIQSPFNQGYGRSINFSGQIAATGTVYFASAKTGGPGYFGIIISGNNTNFTGTAILTNGLVAISHTNALGTNAIPVELRGGNFCLNCNPVKTLFVTTNSTMTAWGNSTYYGNIVLTNNATLLFDSYNGGNSRTLTLNCPISGTGNLQVYSSGAVVTFGGTSANTFTGNVTITKDTLVLNKTAGLDAIPGGYVTIGDGVATNHILQMNAANQVNDSTIVRFGSLSTEPNGLFSCFRLNGCDETVGGLQSQGKGYGTVENGHATTACTLTVSNNVDMIYSGQIRNGATAALNIVKTGSGTWFVNGYATNTGTWTINGGTLGGTGIVACAMNVNSGAVVNPGTNTSVGGTLTITNDLVFAAGAALGFDLAAPTNRNPNATNDLIIGVQNLTFNGNVVNIGGLPGIQTALPGDSWTLIRYSGTLSGSPPIRGSLPGNARPSRVVLDTPGEIKLVVLASGTLITIK